MAVGFFSDFFQLFGGFPKSWYENHDFWPVAVGFFPVLVGRYFQAPGRRVFAIFDRKKVPKID